MLVQTNSANKHQTNKATKVAAYLASNAMTNQELIALFVHIMDYKCDDKYQINQTTEQSTATLQITSHPISQ